MSKIVTGLFILNLILVQGCSDDEMVSLEQISHGARLYETGDSHDSVQCLIEADYVKPAIASLKEMFHLDPGAIREESAETEERG